MKALVSSENAAVANTLAAALRGAGHSVWTAGADRDAVAEFSQHAPSLVIVDVTHSESRPAFIRRLRGILQKQETTILLAGNWTEVALLQAYEAGADGELGHVLTEKLVVARVAALLRLAQRQGQVANGGLCSLERRKKERAEEARGTIGPTKMVAQSAPWQGAAETIEDAASSFLGLRATAEDVSPAANPELACAIVLTSVEHQLELRIALGVDRTSARDLAMHMFGEVDDELAADMTCELSNIFMGALKTSFSSEEIPFASGLPQTIENERVLAPEATFRLQDTFALAIATSKIVVHLGVRSLAPLQVHLGRLEEGMVVAKDIFNARGLLLLSGGTRLSLNMIERMQNTLSKKLEVEVMAS